VHIIWAILEDLIYLKVSHTLTDTSPITYTQSHDMEAVYKTSLRKALIKTL